MNYLRIFFVTTVSWIILVNQYHAMEFGGSFQQEEENNHLNTLFQSIIEYQHDVTADCLAKMPYLVNMYGYYHGKHPVVPVKITPVHMASLMGNVDALKQLLKISTQSINAIVDFDYTPLHCAANKQVAKILLRNGASQKGDWSLLNAHLFPRWLETLDASDGFRKNDVAAYLIKHGIDVDQKYAGETLLYGSAKLYKACVYDIKFLLEHSANPDLPCGDKTPFDLIVDKNNIDDDKLFKKVGFFYCHVDCDLDPFVLLMNNPNNFFDEYRKHFGFCTRNLKIFRLIYTIAKQHERAPYPPLCAQSKPIDIKTAADKKIRTYIFKRPSFADLEYFFGKKAIRCLKKYFGKRFYEVRKLIIDHEDIPETFHEMYNINGIDADGNSLLHTAVKVENSYAIKYLIGDGIDCTITNIKGKTAFDCLKKSDDEDCILSFCDTLLNSFFNKRLPYKADTFVLKNILGWDRFTRLYQMDHFFDMLILRPEIVPSVLKRGVWINYKDERGMTPLAYLVEFLFEKPWCQISSHHKNNLCLLLERGAIVEKKLLGDTYKYMTQEIKYILQCAYHKQQAEQVGKRECCICYQADDLWVVPCIYIHSGFVCKICAARLEACPLCRAKF